MISEGLDKALLEELAQHFNIVREDKMAKGNKPQKNDKATKKPKQVKNK